MVTSQLPFAARFLVPTFMLMGIGAAPEGVISAAAMRCLGGHFQG